MPMTVRLLTRVPADVKTWLLQRANYNASTIGAEVSRCRRERMERESATARDRPPPTKVEAVAE
jgi:hypothetical protein